MRKGKDGLERGLEVVEDGTTEEAARSAKARLNKALEVVSGGEVAPGAKEVALPAYPGLLDLWDYAQEVKHALLASLDASVSLAEDDARLLTSKGVERVASLADKHLPRDVERPQKVFKPEAMFARRPATNRRKSMNVGHVGLGLVNRSELADVSMSDIFDASQQLERLVKYFTLGGGSSSSSDSKKSSFLSIEDGNSTVTTVGFTTALGALGLVTGKTLSTRTIVESIYHLSELLRSPTARKLAGPAIAALTLGLSFYVISDLPNAIPRRIGRSLATRLASEDGRVEGSTGEGSFVEANGERIGRETKRVLRAAAWDLRGSFEGALEERRKEVGKAEEIKKKAERAVDWFEEIVRRTEAVRVEAGWVVDVASDKQHQQQQHEVVA
jgi:mitofusin